MIDGNIDQPTVDAILKTAYLIELEASIDENLKAVAKKQANYFNAFRYSLFSIFPFVICLIFHNFQDDKPNQVEIVNAGKSRIFVEDTIKVRNVK